MILGSVLASGHDRKSQRMKRQSHIESVYYHNLAIIIILIIRDGHKSYGKISGYPTDHVSKEVPIQKPTKRKGEKRCRHFFKGVTVLYSQFFITGKITVKFCVDKIGAKALYCRSFFLNHNSDVPLIRRYATSVHFSLLMNEEHFNTILRHSG